MLAPDDRRLFLQALRPPEGYKFDRGIGTTFTLDLYTLLVTPLSLAFFEYESPERAFEDPLALLESLRRYTDRLMVFCEAGRIDFPANASPLLSYLEEMVIEVKPPRNGAFHPKFWLLRYVSDDTPPLYRLLNLSRNLTFDRSWDLILQLEGQVVHRKNGFSRNRPVADFLAALSSLVEDKATAQVQGLLTILADEVKRVDFLPVEGFDDITFYPSGIPGYRGYPFKNIINRLLVISPFLSDRFLKRLTEDGADHALISRVDSLDRLSASTRDRFENIYTLNEDAEQEPIEASLETSASDNQGDILTLNTHDLSGLHAKLLVSENGREATWLVGSANATEAGFHRNIEFMIELSGNRSKIGIDKILNAEDLKNALINLLIPYRLPEEKTCIDQDQKQAEAIVDNVRRWLVRCDIELEVKTGLNGNYDLRLTFQKILDPVQGEYSLICWPVTLPEGRRQPVPLKGKAKPVRFADVSLVSLTAFMAFDVTATVNKAKHTDRFVLNLPVSGLPPERDDAVLGAVISDKARFLRYLRLLLMDDESDSAGYWSLFSTTGVSSARTWFNEDMPLLEEIVLALSRSNNPGGKIDRIADLVKRLKRTDQDQEIIPPEFDVLWDVVIKAQGGLR